MPQQRHTTTKALLDKLESARHLSSELDFALRMASNCGRVGLTTALGELVLVLIDQVEDLKTQLKEKSSGN